MSDQPIRIAVVGHTNTGKTSLLRTLMRDVSFGEVSDRPAVTRHVEGAALLINNRSVAELYDTPGMEDSIALLDHLEEMRGGRRVEGLGQIHSFLESDAARGRFAQEAKALRQVLASDVALYVIDARDPVLGKHRDELEILARCAVPVVPVLNFVASPDARAKEWRTQLGRVGMHAVVEFDTVVFDAAGELLLFEKLKTLLDAFKQPLDALIEDRTRERRLLVTASANAIADLLIDAAAYVVLVPTKDRKEIDAATDLLRRTVRRREQRCVEQLLQLHRFRADDACAGELPLQDGRWGTDLFSRAALRQFGIRTGSGAAAGAAVGLTIDAVTGGLSLGAATALGAAAGALLGAGREHGRRVLDRLRGWSELRCDDATIRLLATRQVTLGRALLRRGHAAVEPVMLAEAKGRSDVLGRELPDEIDRARLHPEWSRLTVDRAGGRFDSARESARSRLAGALAAPLTADAPTAGGR